MIRELQQRKATRTSDGSSAERAILAAVSQHSRQASGIPSRRKGSAVLNSIRLQHASIVVFTAVLCAVLPSPGWTWGAVGHHYIAQHYSQHLPADLDGLRTYDSEVDAHVTDPDTRKGSTHGESERHFIDIDYYPEFFDGTLPRSRAALEALYSPAIVTHEGVLPWTIGEVVTRLTQQFQTQQWSAASLTIADLCHYVGDANHPLHCTANFDGEDTGNSGIHSRHESTMISDYLAQLDTPAMTTAYYSSPLDATFDVIAASWAGVSPILMADNVARDEARGSTSGTAYYASLWNSTRTLTQARLDTASVMTASLVYTAWMDAGQPTVGAEYGVRLLAGPSPFRDALTVTFAAGGPLSVDVFDVRGVRVARLADNFPGGGSVTWRPGSSGTAVRPGIYFVRLSAPGTKLVRKVALVP
jgi:hypothetical protein